MKVKSKLMEALASLKDQAMIGKATITGLKLLSGIEIAIVRSTDHHDTPIDDKYIHEILFRVSNAPRSITFLARIISTRLDTTRHPVVSLKTLLLLHRLLRGCDRYFEQDLHNLFTSQELRLDLRWLLGNSNPSCSFILNYAKFLEERMGWFINQAGKLEPIITSSSEIKSYEENAVELVLYRASKCQTFLDRIMDCFPISILRSSHAAQLAMNISIRESFQVYDSFCEGTEIIVNSFVNFKKPTRVTALDILKKACAQTPNLHEFYENCKRSLVGKSLDYPSVSILSMKQLSFTDCNSTPSLDENTRLFAAKVEPREGSIPRFDHRLETKVSTVWVEFGDDDYSETSSISFRVKEHQFVGVADDLLAEGESSMGREAMELL